MTIDVNYSPNNFWSLDWFPPQPRQDSELLDRLGFIPGLKELLILRQVHALEHATVWVLNEIEAQHQGLKDRVNIDRGDLGGLSTEKGFYLYGSVISSKIKKAAKIALERIEKGEWHLALHPRCGTNASVGMVLTAGSIAIAHILLPKRPIEQLIGCGLAAAIADRLKPEIGIIVQKYLTTAIPFNLTIGDVKETIDIWGRSAYFVGVQWQD
jgi:hypothetical protein